MKTGHFENTQMFLFKSSDCTFLFW